MVGTSLLSFLALYFLASLFFHFANRRGIEKIQLEFVLSSCAHNTNAIVRRFCELAFEFVLCQALANGPKRKLKKFLRCCDKWLVWFDAMRDDAKQCCGECHWTNFRVWRKATGRLSLVLTHLNDGNADEVFYSVEEMCFLKSKPNAICFDFANPFSHVCGCWDVWVNEWKWFRFNGGLSHNILYFGWNATQS